MCSARLVRHLARQLAALCAAAGSTACMAGVATIYEGGPTVPIGQYLAAFFTQEPAPVTNGAVPPRNGTLPVAFPVTTRSMRPGRLETPLRLRTAGWLAAPMFMVGDDPLSKQWLATNRERLHRSGATGLVVNVASIEAFRALRGLVPDVPMAPGSVEGLAQQVRLSVYPLFVSIDGQVSQLVP
jgi:integrating conjugative element protein (TIGR03765 family)